MGAARIGDKGLLKKNSKWGKIQKEKQREGKTVTQWEHCLSQLMADYSGIHSEEKRMAAMRTVFAAGLWPKLQQIVKTTCIEWLHVLSGKRPAC